MSGPRPADLLRHLAGGDADAPDRDLLRRYASTRDDGAFAELVRRHGPVVLAACRRGTFRREDAEDAFQAVFLILARRAGAVGQPDLLGNWLYRVAVRVARDARRTAARRRVREVQGVDAPEPEAPPAAAPDNLGPVLDEELDALPALYRDAVVMCDLRGLPRADAAAHLGIPPGTLASRLDAARKKLAARLVRRGVALSVAAGLAEGRAAAVPDGLFTKTCGLVAGWAAGAAVPAEVLRLARGGSTMRGVILGGALTLSLAAGAALAVGLADPPAAPPPQPPDPPAAVARPEARPAPGAAKEQPPAKLGPPRLKRTADLRLRAVEAVAWSGNGEWLAVAGMTSASPPQTTDPDVLVVLAASDPKATPGQLPLPANSELVGFTTDGKWVLAATRETGLISGEHLLHRMAVARREPRDPKDFEPPVVLARDDRDPATVPDGGEQLTPTGPQDVRFLVRGADRVTVWHTDPRFEARWPLGGFDGSFGAVLLTPDGRRVVALAGGGAVEGYDAKSGGRLWTTGPAEKLPAVKFQPQGLTSREQIPPSAPLAIGLSRDGRRAVVARGWVTPVLVLDLDSGKSLPLPAELGVVDPMGPVALSGDGRLAALAYTALRPLEGKEMAKSGPGFTAPTHARGPSRLVVWDTAAGRVVRTWEGRAAAVAFHPTRPVLAVLEGYAGGMRLGLWDFAAQP